MSLSIIIIIFLVWYFINGYLITHYGPIATYVKKAENQQYDMLRIRYIMDDKSDEEIQAKWPMIRFTFRLVCILIFPLLGIWRLLLFFMDKEWKSRAEKPIFRPKGFYKGSAHLACLECGYRDTVTFRHTDLHLKIFIFNIQCATCLTFQKRKVSIFIQPWKRNYGICHHCHNPLKPAEFLHCPACKTQHITYRRIEGTALRERIKKMDGEQKRFANKILLTDFVPRKEEESIAKMVREKEERTAQFTRITNAKSGLSKLKRKKVRIAPSQTPGF